MLAVKYQALIQHYILFYFNKETAEYDDFCGREHISINKRKRFENENVLMLEKNRDSQGGKNFNLSPMMRTRPFKAKNERVEQQEAFSQFLSEGFSSNQRQGATKTFVHEAKRNMSIRTPRRSERLRSVLLRIWQAVLRFLQKLGSLRNPTDWGGDQVSNKKKEGLKKILIYIVFVFVIARMRRQFILFKWLFKKNIWAVLNERPASYIRNRSCKMLESRWRDIAKVLKECPSGIYVSRGGALEVSQCSQRWCSRTVPQRHGHREIN